MYDESTRHTMFIFKPFVKKNLILHMIRYFLTFLLTISFSIILILIFCNFLPFWRNFLRLSLLPFFKAIFFCQITLLYFSGSKCIFSRLFILFGHIFSLLSVFLIFYLHISFFQLFSFPFF